ncbi:MAG: terminase TerL endonuclease subunit [Bacilli bacterium]
MLLGYMALIKSLLTDFGQCYVVATKRDQSAIVINEIRKMLSCSIPQIKDRFKIYGKATINKIVCTLTESEMAPLSSDANTLDGLGVDLAIVDEFGAHPSYELYEVMRSSQTYKPNSMIVIITTAYSNSATSPAFNERNLLVDAYEGKVPFEDRYFAAIYELDSEDLENLDNSDLWDKANPLFAQFPIIKDKMRADYESSLRDKEKYRLFLTKNLNVWLTGDGAESYVDYESWMDCQVDTVDFQGREVVVGVDMSKSVDLCGLTIMAKDEDGNYLMKSKAFLPKDAIPGKEISDKMPYQSYANADEDWLTATDGKFVNQLEVEDYIRNIERLYNCKIKTINFDAWGALYLMSSLSQDYEVVDVKMSYRYFSPSVKSFRERIYDGRIKHEFNPILNFCVANAVTKSDLQENILLDKKKSVNRIDLLVSAIIAYNEFVEEETSQEFGDYFLV